MNKFKHLEAILLLPYCFLSVDCSTAICNVACNIFRKSTMSELATVN